jgi:hypothetical protein
MPLFTLTSSQNGIHFNRLKNWIVDDISISLGIHFNRLKSWIVDVNTRTPYISITLVYIHELVRALHRNCRAAGSISARGV